MGVEDSAILPHWCDNSVTCAWISIPSLLSRKGLAHYRAIPPHCCDSSVTSACIPVYVAIKERPHSLQSNSPTLLWQSGDKYMYVWIPAHFAIEERPCSLQSNSPTLLWQISDKYMYVDICLLCYRGMATLTTEQFSHTVMTIQWQVHIHGYLSTLLWRKGHAHYRAIFPHCCDNPVTSACMDICPPGYHGKATLTSKAFTQNSGSIFRGPLA